MIRTIIVDDHEIIRKGFTKIIDKESDICIVGEAKNASDALRLINEKECDVLILDITMPGKSGYDLLKDLKISHPEIKTLILSIHPEDQFAIRALKLNAAGYINKACNPDELLMAIRRIAEGRKYISQTLAEQIAGDYGSDKNVNELLSEREFEVFLLIARGRTISEAAKHLSLSISTITTYRTRILEKLQLKSNAEIIYYAIKHKFVDVNNDSD
jgi:two-component system, NarL family, invasion response regulator UvrY